MKYRTFIRNWWIANKDYHGGLEPHPGRKTHNAYHSTMEEARNTAQEYNRTHNPGKLSRKMEFESV